MKKAEKLKEPIPVRNVDGSFNEGGEITHRIALPYTIEGVRFKDWFLITLLGDQRMILGIPWLKKHDPIITWSTMTMSLDQTKIKKNQQVLDKLREEF